MTTRTFGGYGCLVPTSVQSLEPPLYRTHLVLPVETRSVPAAREFTRSAFDRWDVASDTAGTAELIVSELVTNALQHGTLPGDPAQQCVRLDLWACAGRVGCRVWSPGEGQPVLQDAGPAAECGRGLMIVAALSSGWGSFLCRGGGMAVWAQLKGAA